MTVLRDRINEPRIRVRIRPNDSVIRIEEKRSFLPVPTIVKARNSQIDLFDIVLSNVPDDELVQDGIKTKSLGVSQPPDENLMDYRAQFTSQTIEENNLAREQKVEADKKRAAEIAKKIETLRQQQEAEMQRQHEAEMQRQQLEAEQQRQVLTQPTYSPISGRDPGTPVRAYTGLHNRFWRYTHPPQTRRAVSRTDFS